MTQAEFIYDDTLYTLNVTLQDCNGQVGIIPLISENIGEIQYTNELNCMTPTGTIEYTDTDGKIDRFIEQQFVFCNIVFSKVTTEYDGEIEIRHEYETDTMILQFIVDNFEILDNEPGRIKYRLHLVDTNWMDLQKDVYYSTYGNKEQPIFTIIKDILNGQSGIDTDGDTFKQSDSQNKIDYITQNNDNGYSSVSYLLNKLYYQYGNVDTNLKGLVFSEYSRKMFLFDTAKTGKFQDVYTVKINQVKNDTDIACKEPVNIACVIRKTKTQTLDSIFTTRISEYDIESNSFVTKEMDSQSIINYYSNNDKNCKLFPMPEPEKYIKHQMMWNNSIDIYNEQMSNLMGNGGLIVNIVGKIGIIPGWFIGITCPIDGNMTNSESTQANEDAKNMFQGITGSWIVSKVTNFINPQENIFRQTINLMRSEKVMHNP